MSTIPGDPFLPSIEPVEDDASHVINTFMAVMLEAFDPNDSVQPPLGGGSTTVRFLAGDMIPLELWDAQVMGDAACAEPLLWVRMTRRFRFKNFPASSNEAVACSLPRAIGIEIGVGRCCALETTTDWTVIQTEAEVSLDDSWRIELALCRASSQMKAQDRLISIGDVTPTGPEGGVVAWSATAVVKL